MKQYTIIGGVNGTGKSSLTGALKAQRNDLGTIIDVDKLNASCHGDRRQGGKAAVEKIEQCLAKGLSFTQETTLAGRRTERTIRKAKELGYRIRLYYVGLDSVEDSRQRIHNRVTRGGHDIPAKDVERRFSTRFADVFKILPYCDEAKFFDNNNGFVLVAEYRNGELLPIGDFRPQWLREMLEYEAQG